MTVLLTHDDVASLVDMPAAIAAMAEVFRLEGEGHAGAPERYDMPTGRGWLRLMPVVVQGMDAFGFKAMHLTRSVGVRYAIWVYGLESGDLRGVLDGRLITAMRTAATTALATDLLARSNVRRTAIIGTGHEARTHLEAMQAVRPVDEVRVFSRSAENRATFIKEMSSRVKADLIDCAGLEQTIKGVELVVLATKSAEPVVNGGHLEPGMHVNSIGAARPDQFELAPDTFPQITTMVCDSAKHVFAEAGDAVAALAAGVADLAGVENLADLVVGRGRGRTSDEDVTLYKSVGTATQDIALACRLLDLAERRGIGRELGAFPDIKSFA